MTFGLLAVARVALTKDDYSTYSVDRYILSRNNIKLGSKRANRNYNS